MIITSTGIVINEDIRAGGIVSSKEVKLTKEQIEDIVSRFKGTIYYSADYDTVRMIKESRILKNIFMYPLAKDRISCIDTIEYRAGCDKSIPNINAEYKLLATLFNRAVLVDENVKWMFTKFSERSKGFKTVRVASAGYGVVSDACRYRYITKAEITEKLVATISNIAWESRSILLSTEDRGSGRNNIEIKISRDISHETIRYKIKQITGVELMICE